MSRTHISIPTGALLVMEGKRRTRCGLKVDEMSIAVPAKEATCRTCRKGLTV